MSDLLEIQKGQDCTLEVRVFAGTGRADNSPVRAVLDADALNAATSLTVKALDDALSNGDKLLFGKNTVVTLGAAAAAGVTALTVTAIPGPLKTGDVGRKLQDLTNYTIVVEVLEKRGDATPQISLTGAAITLPAQTGDDRGKVQAALVAADTSALAAKTYFASVWRRNAGTSRRLAELDIRLVESGFL